MKCSGGRTSGTYINWRNALIKDLKPSDLYCPHSYTSRPLASQCRQEPVCPSSCTCAPASRLYDRHNVLITLDCRDQGLDKGLG